MATPQAIRKQDLEHRKRVEELLNEILARLASLEKKVGVSDAKTTQSAEK